MCGILCVYGHDVEVKQDILKHRGPDMSRAYTNKKIYMEFSRLAINDLSESGMQPFIDESHAFMCNGEMYNHEQYADAPDVSDCLTLFRLIREVGAFEACKIIKGSEFAFVYYDGEHLFVARDPIGVRPLFYTFANGLIAFASEMKALIQFKNDIFVFPPGHVYCSGTEHFGCFYTIYWTIPKSITPKSDLKSVLIECVRDRVKSTHRDIGFLLSGGLDSSLICSIACGLMTPSQRERVQTFTIGEKGSPDVLAAEQVAADQPAGEQPWAARPPCANGALLAPRRALGSKRGR
jgi:asparagine synthase (glutamine-hydrolysing)